MPFDAASTYLHSARQPTEHFEGKKKISEEKSEEDKKMSFYHKSIKKFPSIFLASQME